MRLLHLSLLLSTFLSSLPSFIYAQAVPLHQDLDHTLLLLDTRAYRKFDSHDFNDPEISATAVSPFCKSFTFLCHIRCLQRGDPRDAGAVLPNTDDARAEISRCIGPTSMSGPGSNSVKMLCLCGNRVDLTAEISYALEGIVDIQAAGGSGSGEGEAGKIRQVAYKTVTQTHTEYKTQVVTMTATVTEQVMNTRLPMPEAREQGEKKESVVQVPVVGGVSENNEKDDREQEGEPFKGLMTWDSYVEDYEKESNGEGVDDVDLFPEYEDNYLNDDADLDDAEADQVDGIEYDLSG